MTGWKAATAAGFAAFVFTSTPALAVTFNLTGNGDNLGKTEFFGTIDGISMTALGFKNVIDSGDLYDTLPAVGSLNDANLQQTNDGLGVDGDNDNASEGDRIGRGDAIRFEFTPDVWLLGALTFEVGSFDERFALYDSNGNQVISNDPEGGGEYFVIAGDTASDNVSIDLSSFNIVGSAFTIVGVTCSPCLNNDNEDNRGFRIASLEVKPSSEFQAAVPLPAALPLLAGGVGLLGFIGWRRRGGVALR